MSAGLILLIAPLIAARITGGSSYQVEDSGMAPVLLVGDWVLAEKIDPEAPPPRGAIVAIDAPGFPGEYDIRRIMGLPGERVQMRGGALYIDGKRAQMTRLDDRVIARRPPAIRRPMPLCINDPVQIDGPCHQERWLEILPDGTETVVLNSRGRIGALRLGGEQTPDDTRTLVVPEGAVFVIGDNRDASEDSRMPGFGMVPVSKILHRVWLIHSSVDKSGRLFHPRFGRFFRRVG